MYRFQILDTCVKEIGSCCQDYSLITLLDIVRKIFDIIQIIVPIFLIVMATFNFIILVANPETKNGIKKIINQFLAALIIFFIPTFLNVVLNMMPSSFQIADCWNQAKNNAEILKANELKFQITDGRKKTSILVNPSDYEKGEKKEDTVGSATGKKIAEYALQFVGEEYELFGKWDGNLPYTPTCCAGFVSGVYSHFGYKIYSSNPYLVTDLRDNKKVYVEISGDEIQAGDIVFYPGHVAILTGKGEEIVHASGESSGVKTTSTYKYTTPVKIVRIKGIE